MIRALILAALLTSPVYAAAAVTVPVPIAATCETLAPALLAVLPGGTIKLTGSCTAGLTIRDRKFVPAITIDASKAVLLGGLKFFKAGGVHVIGGQYGPAAKGGSGFSTDYSDDVWITGARVTGLDFGINFNRSTNVRAIKNRVDFIRVDGIRVFSTQRALIDGNAILGAAPIDPKARHPDAFQGASDYSVASDVTVTNNTVIGDAQGITFFSGKGAGYDRITITGNYVATSYPQAIACYKCRDSIVERNTIVTLPSADKKSSLNVYDAVGWKAGANTFIDNRR